GPTSGCRDCRAIAGSKRDGVGIGTERFTRDAVDDFSAYARGWNRSDGPIDAGEVRAGEQINRSCSRGGDTSWVIYRDADFAGVWSRVLALRQGFYKVLSGLKPEDPILAQIVGPGPPNCL